MNGSQRDRLGAFMARRLVTGAAPLQLAEAIRTACSGVDRAPVPIVGQRGVEALFKHSLHLCARLIAYTSSPVANTFMLASGMDAVPDELCDAQTLQTCLLRWCPPWWPSAGLDGVVGAAQRRLRDAGRQPRCVVLKHTHCGVEQRALTESQGWWHDGGGCFVHVWAPE